MTVGVAALGAEAVDRIVKTIAVFDDFCHANDPHEEHDFGAFEADGHRIFFKIDYFDQSLSIHSPDPADPVRHPAGDHDHAGGGVLRGRTFILAGFTEAKGSETYNQGLSERRADAVRQLLSKQYGIEAGNLVTVGYSLSQLKDPANPFAAENRRVQVINAAEK